jgi:hypothetical protein
MMLWPTIRSASINILAPVAVVSAPKAISSGAVIMQREHDPGVDVLEDEAVNAVELVEEAVRLDVEDVSAHGNPYSQSIPAQVTDDARRTTSCHQTHLPSTIWCGT